MKNRHLLLLTLLLTQTTSLWAMEHDDEEFNGGGAPHNQHQQRAAGGNNNPHYQFNLVGDVTRPAQGNPRGRFQITQQGGNQTTTDLELQNIQLIRMEPFLSNQINTLNPSDPLPQDLGTARERVRCTVDYNGNVQQIEVLLPTQHPLHGQWLFQENRDNTQNIATLKLRALSNSQRWVDVFQRQVNIQHRLVDAGVETLGGYYFNGDTVYQARTRRQQWRNPDNQREYTRTIAVRDVEVPSHTGNQIIYVEPFAFGTDLLRPRDAYRGTYTFIRDLAEHEGLLGKKEGSLVYSDGNHIYLPHITQELWGQDQSQTCFFIASYKQERKLNFISQARIPGGRLAEGLYQMVSVKEESTSRTERWKKLEEDTQNSPPIEIITPAGVPSIPGMGSFVPRVVPPNNATVQVVNLQNELTSRNLRMSSLQEYIAQYPHANGFVFILGPAGSGKTVLAHILAQRQLHAEEDEDGILRLDTNNPLPGFVIGHGAQAGTTFPAVWYDQDQNLFLTDCPGFGDPGGVEPDILNAFSIHHLLMNRGNIKIVMAIKEGEVITRSAHFIKLLNDITGVFQSDQDLQNNLSFVVTHQRQVRNGFGPFLERILNTVPQLSDRAKNLLRFLIHNHNRVSSIPEVQNEGPFNFNAQLVRGGVTNSRYVLNPQVRMEVGNDANFLVATLSQNLNDYLTHYMGTEGSQRVINHCLKLIDAHQNSVGALRTSLGQFITTLEDIRRIPAESLLLLPEQLRAMMNVDDMTKAIEQLCFFKRINNDVRYNTAACVSILLDNTLQKIRQLTVAPQEEYMGNILTLKGTLIGTSDINAALRRHPNPTTINVFGLNTLLVDEDVTSHGTSTHLIAPQWKVVGVRSIDLSGKDGANGAHGTHGSYSSASGRDGQPGAPGGNGGHFWGKGFTFDHLDQLLTVNTNGGDGGNGGNGGNGADGADVRDDDPVEYREVYIKEPYWGKVRKYYNLYYLQRGFPGQPGGNAGRGGNEGKGGYSGDSILQGHPWNAHPRNGQPRQGGTPGTPGNGGRHGRDMEGHYNSESDKWLIPRGLKSYKGYADSGRVPPPRLPGELVKTVEVIVEQQQLVAQTRLDPAPIVQQYKLYYLQEANNPIVSSFIKMFPNLN